MTKKTSQKLHYIGFYYVSGFSFPLWLLMDKLQDTNVNIIAQVVHKNSPT